VLTPKEMQELFMGICLTLAPQILDFITQSKSCNRCYLTDKTVQIKINEVVNILKPLDKNQNVKDDNIMALLQFHQLIAELKSVK
jgi:hypothetical protein